MVKAWLRVLLRILRGCRDQSASVIESAWVLQAYVGI
jgi:hypothetical protein